MVDQIPNTYVTKFTSNMRMALNQQDSRLAVRSMREDGSGEMYQLQNIVGAGTVRFRTTRNADVIYDDNTFDRVWVAQPGETYIADLIDKLDRVASGIELQGAYTMKQAAAIKRARDAMWIGGFDGTGGFYGSMLTGKRGEVSVPFANANIVPVTTGASGPTGLNIRKVIAAREILVAGHVDAEQDFYLGVTANEVSDLFNQVEVTSGDFRESLKPRISADGKSLLGLMGFEFVEIELNNVDLPFFELTKDGNGYQKNPFWSKDGMAMVYWYDLMTSIDRVPTKHNAIQVLSQMSGTSTRTDNARCGMILNN